MRKLIEALVPALKEINHTFNGVQIYDHERVIDVCAIENARDGFGIHHVIIRSKDSGRSLCFDVDAQIPELVSEAIRKFQDYVEINREYACPWGIIPKSRSTGAILDKERYADWHQRHDGFTDRGSRNGLMMDIDKVYASGAITP